MLTRAILCGLLFSASTECLLASNDSNYKYLALGDSIAFGLDPTLLITNPAAAPDQFTGYPEIVAQVEHLLQNKEEVNAACPGETSASFMDVGEPDNGCNGRGPQGQPPFKITPGLHTNYSGSQLDFAVSQLTSNTQINLVTLGIGGNDLLQVEAQCAAQPIPSFPDCVKEILPVTLQSYAKNLTSILAVLRANYRGTLVLVETYSPSNNPLFIEAVAALNSVMMEVGRNFGVKFAHAFAAFQLLSALQDGDPCTAGLLIRLTATDCDIDPSPSGRDLLAATVILATRAISIRSPMENRDRLTVDRAEVRKRESESEYRDVLQP